MNPNLNLRLEYIAFIFGLGYITASQQQMATFNNTSA